MGGSDGHPGAIDPVDRNQEEAVERLRVRGRNSRDEAVRAAVEESEGEVVALVRVRGENRFTLVEQRRESRNTSGDREHDEDGGTVDGERNGTRSCPATLSDRSRTGVGALRRAAASSAGGFAIAALMRPADPSFGEDETLWLERARGASLGPLGHHTHWTAPDHARPTDGGTGERVLAEGARLRELA